jgi:hypothetical protein
MTLGELTLGLALRAALAAAPAVPSRIKNSAMMKLNVRMNGANKRLVLILLSSFARRAVHTAGRTIRGSLQYIRRASLFGRAWIYCTEAV